MMNSVHDPPKTWEIRLATGKLSENEWQILTDMVSSGQADSLEEAARIMGFLEREQNLDDTFQSDWPVTGIRERPHAKTPGRE